MRRPPHRHHAEPVHRVQPPPEVRPPRRARRPARLRRRRHRPPRPPRRRRRRAARRPRRGRGQGPELRRAHARPGASWRARCSRSAISPRPRCASGPPTLGLRTADKPDSQDVCFITEHGRAASVPRPADPAPRRAGRRPRRATHVGEVRRGRAGHARSAPRARSARRAEAVRGRRRRRSRAGGGRRRRSRPARRRCSRSSPRCGATCRRAATCSCSAAPTARRCRRRSDDGVVRWHEPQRVVAAGQSVVFYDPTDRWVLGGGARRALSRPVRTPRGGRARPRRRAPGPGDSARRGRPGVDRPAGRVARVGANTTVAPARGGRSPAGARRDGPVRSAASVPCRARPTRASAVRCTSSGLGQHEVVVHDEPGRARRRASGGTAGGSAGRAATWPAAAASTSSTHADDPHLVGQQHDRRR